MEYGPSLVAGCHIRYPPSYRTWGGHPGLCGVGPSSVKFGVVETPHTLGLKQLMVEGLGFLTFR